MSATSNRLLGWIFGNRGQYQPLNPDLASQTEGSSTPLNDLPGYFPNEEETQIRGRSSRNHFNSIRINESFKSFGQVINFLIIKPIILMLIVSFRLLAKLLNIIYFKDVHTARSRSLSNTTSNNNLMNDPIDRASKFVRALEDNLSPEQQFDQNHSVKSLPPFFQGSYTQALYMSHQKAKFLFVYLNNNQNENSSSIFDKIITNPKFVSLFSNDIIIWGGDLTNPEAYQLANTLNVTKFPFLGLLCLTRSTTMSPQGPVKTSPKVSLILKIQGSISNNQDPNVVINNKFEKKIHKYEDELLLIRKELKDKFLSQVLLRQQDINYQNSLAKDRLRKQEKDYEKLKKEYLSWKSLYFENLKNNQVSDSARVAIKLQNGKRVTFHFPPDNFIDDIFTYVELYNGGYLNNHIDVKISDEEAIRKFKDFKLIFKFKLQSPLPPKQVLNDFLNNNVMIKNISCIYPNGLLMAQED